LHKEGQKTQGLYRTQRVIKIPGRLVWGMQLVVSGP